MTDLSIRPYRSDDFDAVTLLWRRSREVSLPDFQRQRGHTFDEDRAYFREHILFKNRIWVAQSAGAAAGFMAIEGEFIDCLYVHPDRWREGIGRALLDHARTLSPGHLWLYTLQINRNARAFYEKYGFVAVRWGVSPPPESEPDVEYHWRPSSS